MTLARGCEFKAVFLLGLALLSYGVQGARRGLAGTDPTIFDVTQYGAQADCKTDNSRIFINTWNAACQSSGMAKLLIPNGTFLVGEVIFQGPCKCSNPITIEVQGTLLAKTDLSAYPSGQWFLFRHVTGLLLTGQGSFNGQGETAWKFNSGSPKLLPISIKIDHTNNTLVQGIKLINSKGFHMKVTSCNNVTVQGLNITAPDDSPNTDGIHISRSDLVKISNTVIGTGDDCISIGEGSTNISISGITCGPGHGISIGSLGKVKTEKDVKGIVVTNCTLSNTENGARIKTFEESPKTQASNIVFEDIVMNNVRNPIIIDQHYMCKNKNKGPSNVKISNVHYKNIRGTTVSNVAVALNCSEAVPCEGVELVDIDLKSSGISEKIESQSTISGLCSNAKATFSGKQNPSACT
ncbi:exopolygalacturonase clone GBGE184-like [Cornus florida]|uniref:exopolygalacturonase clone GBGE184-like n=1 Tax=Cornus florida TaxID=4283 RepID=UPI00289AD558|nr:exopolygalacturonase clone GBGE184-like [Cornus florida]